MPAVPRLTRVFKNLLNETLFDIPNVRQVYRQENQQGITVNQDVRLSVEQTAATVLRPSLQPCRVGSSFKTYLQANYQTNIFKFVE